MTSRHPNLIHGIAWYVKRILPGPHVFDHTFLYLLIGQLTCLLVCVWVCFCARVSLFVCPNARTSGKAELFTNLQSDSCRVFDVSSSHFLYQQSNFALTHMQLALQLVDLQQQSRDLGVFCRQIGLAVALETYQA